MNEIELLKRFREDVPGPDEATVQAARSALMGTIKGPPRHLGRAGSYRRRIALGLTAASAAVLALAIVISMLLPRGGTSAAAAELRRFADVAANQKAPGQLGPGQFHYLRREGRDRVIVVPETRDGAYTAQFALVREYWIGADGSGRAVEQRGELIWPSPRDKMRGEADGSALSLAGHSDEQSYGPGELVGPKLDGGELGTLPSGYSFETLPRDPQALYEAIRAAASERETAGSSPEAISLGTFGLFIELLHTPLTPPDIRAALFEAMAYTPGITVVPEKSIPGIGTGAAVFIDTHWGEVRIRLEFLVDSGTSELLGYQETQLDRGYWLGAEAPFVMTRIAYTSPRVVDSKTERP